MCMASCILYTVCVVCVVCCVVCMNYCLLFTGDECCALYFAFCALREQDVFLLSVFVYGALFVLDWLRTRLYQHPSCIKLRKCVAR